MNTSNIMSATFEAEKNRKALTYTILICGAILLITLLVSWKDAIHQPKAQEELIEINLGNDDEGFGEEQPLIKGEKSPSSEAPEPQQSSAVQNKQAEDYNTDDATDNESAPVTKPVKTTTKIKTNSTVVTPTPKPQKPKIAGYSGPKGGTGNGADEDNGYKYQGNKPGGTGDAGSPNGKPDSYGNNPGGKTGRPEVIGNRKIIRYYSFTGNLKKATIYAIVKVSPDGIGTFAGFAKNSTNMATEYKSAIINYLRNVKFDKSTEESTVTVRFNFNVQ